MKKLYYLFMVLGVCSYAQVPNNTVPKYLDGNKVKARMNTVNNKFWNIYGNNKPSYEVPRGKGTHAQFCNSIWIGGYDSQGLLHVSANTYRQAGYDFWPGPLDTANIGAFTSSNTAVYNKLWKVDCNDINNFMNAYSSGSVSAGTYTVPADILEYPAKGIANFQKNLEPFYDADGDGQYSPVNSGDYPIIKGHQQILTIYNDKFAAHTESKGLPMGIEIHERAYCYRDSLLPDTMQAVNYTTFYNYVIYNRSAETYTNVYIGNWSDVDLGNFQDDYIGTDTVNNFTYCYNGDNNDQNASGLNGYGQRPPVISHAILKTPCATDGIDNDADGLIDEAGEQFRLNSSTYYMSTQSTYSSSSVGIPDSAIHYYRYMSRRWKDGTHLTSGGTGYGGSTPGNYIYPGNPISNSGWTESSAGIAPHDCRVISSSGPFILPAHGKIEWGYAIVFSQDTTLGVNTISYFDKRVQRDVRNIRYYDETHQSPQCLPSISIGLEEISGPFLRAQIYPNPAYDKITVRLSENVKEASVKLIDISGRVIRETSISNGSGTSLQIQDLDSGVYFVEVSSENAKAIQKLVKSK